MWTQPTHAAERSAAPAPEARPSIDEITGFLKFLAAVSNDAAISVADLVAATGYDNDRLLAVVDAARVLQFVAVAAGSVTLGSAGRQYAKGSEAQRKRILADQLGRIPFVAKLRNLLEVSPRHSIRIDELCAGVDRDPSRSDADQIVAWAHHAGLVAIEGESGVLHLRL